MTSPWRRTVTTASRSSSQQEVEARRQAERELALLRAELERLRLERDVDG